MAAVFVTATASNSSAAAVNLVSNPSLETQAGGFPTCFQKTGWGTNTATYSVLNTGAHTGTYSVKLVMAGYASGDSKLVMTESALCAPQVTAGHQYDLSVFYTSTTASSALTVFKHTATGWSYWTDLKSLPAVGAWTLAAARTPVIPADVDQISFGVSLYANGTVKTDDYSATDVAVAPPPPIDPTCTGLCATGRWDVQTYNSTVRAVHSIMLYSGKVLIMAGSGNDETMFKAGTFKSTLYDPTAGTFKDIPTPVDLFCSGHAQLPNGNVLIMGGTGAYPTTVPDRTYTGLATSYIFNVATSAYQKVNNMNDGHWYPSATSLGNGDVITLGGIDPKGEGTVQTEYFSVAANAWKSAANVKQTYSWWGLYPTMILMQDGRLFYTGAHVFGDGLPGSGASIYNYTTGAITDVPGLRNKDGRDQSTAILLPPAQAQKVAIFGGGNVDTNVDANPYTDVIDLSKANPTYMAGMDMPAGTMDDGTAEPAGDGKMYTSAVILPSGKVLEVNGGIHNRADNVHEASIYDPTTGTFAPVPSDPVGRGYHNEALLLPDGRVLSVGGNPGDGSFEMRVSIYSPGYLFSTARPTVTPASTDWHYGTSSVLAVTSSNPIRSAQLVKPAAITHSSDSNARSVDLPLTVSGNSYTANLTSNPNLAPPGYYMLNVVDSNGVPSIAKWIKVS